MRSVPLSAGANQVKNLIGGRQPAGLGFGIDSLTVNENVQPAWLAKADTSGNPQFVFDALFQAHGLRPDITSKETTLDFDGHSDLIDTTFLLSLQFPLPPPLGIPGPDPGEAMQSSCPHARLPVTAVL